MTLTITLTSAGANIGPCDLYSNVNGYLTAFATGITRAQLMSGYVSTVVPNGTTIVRIKSTGTCTDSIDLTVSGNAPITFTVTTTCDAPGTPGTGRVVLSNFQGGNGIYSYVAIGATPAEVAADLIDQLTPLNGATSYTYTNLANDSWFVGIADSTGTRGQDGTTVACNDCNPAASWVASGSYYYSCSDGTVTATIVYIDDNTCSPTYNQYKLNNVVYLTNPGNSYPSTARVWTDTGETRCNECVNEKEQEQTNPCATLYGEFRWVAGGSACDTSQVWANNGTYACYETCNKYNVEEQTNPCATQFGETRQGSLVESNSTFCGGCCGQSTAANWEDVGIPFCSECVAFQLQIDRNPCSATYDDSRYVNLGAGAPCTYTAVWENRDINTYYVCVGVNKYYEQIDTNPCSPTYNTTQTGALYQTDSVDCGYVPVLVPTSLQLSLDDYNIINSCGGTNTAQTWINKFTLLDQNGNVMNAPSNITINMEDIESNCLSYNTYPYSITLLAGNSFVLDNYYSYTGYEECPYDQQCTQYIDATYYVSNESGLAYIP